MPLLQANQVNALLTSKLIQDLVIECNNSTQVVIKSGSVVGMDDGSAIVSVPLDTTLDITTSGAFGLDTGAEAIDTWYYIYLIHNPVTGAISGVFSASATSPTLPAGYTQKRMVGAVRNDGSSDFLLFDQVGINVQYDVGHLLYSATNNSWVAVTAVSYMPSNTRKMTAVGAMASNSDILIRLRPSGQLNKGVITSGDQQLACTCEFLTDASRGFSIYSGSGTLVQISLYIQGYELSL